jgi:tetratricopeptide (TPR) repeat protein
VTNKSSEELLPNLKDNIITTGQKPPLLELADWNSFSDDHTITPEAYTSRLEIKRELTKQFEVNVIPELDLKIGINSTINELQNLASQLEVIQNTNPESITYNENLLMIAEQLMQKEVIEDKNVVRSLHHSQGDLYYQNGDYRNAAAYYKFALQNLETEKDKTLAIEIIVRLAEISFKQLAIIEAEGYMRQLLELLKNIDCSKEDLSKIYLDLGKVYETRGNYDKALDYYWDAIQLALEINSDKLKFEGYIRISDVQIEAKALDRATVNLMNLTEPVDQFNDLQRYYSVLNSISKIKLAEGKLIVAETILNECLRVNQKIRNMDQLGTTLHQLAKIFHQRGLLDYAIIYSKEAEKFLSHSNNVIALAKTKMDRAIIYMKTGNYSLSSLLLKQVISVFSAVSSQIDLTTALLYMFILQVHHQKQDGTEFLTQLEKLSRHSHYSYINIQYKFALAIHDSLKPYSTWKEKQKSNSVFRDIMEEDQLDDDIKMLANMLLIENLYFDFIDNRKSGVETELYSRLEQLHHKMLTQRSVNLQIYYNLIMAKIGFILKLDFSKALPTLILTYYQAIMNGQISDVVQLSDLLIEIKGTGKYAEGFMQHLSGLMELISNDTALTAYLREVEELSKLSDVEQNAQEADSETKLLYEIIGKRKHLLRKSLIQSTIVKDISMDNRLEKEFENIVSSSEIHDLENN